MMLLGNTLVPGDYVLREKTMLFNLDDDGDDSGKESYYYFFFSQQLRPENS